MIHSRKPPRPKAVWYRAAVERGEIVENVKTWKRIPSRSKKRAKQEREYIKRNRLFLARLENRLCKICILRGIYPPHPADQIHHVHGRSGDLLLDESKWMPSCGTCHPLWVEQNREEARKLGILPPYGKFNPTTK